jgi:hypothetical protein
VAFEACVERKWKDALNVAAGEPQAWEADTPRKDKGHQERPAWGRSLWEKPTGIARRNTRLAGAVNVEMYQPPSGNRRCMLQEFMGCGGNHTAAFCNKLQELDPKAKQRALAASGLCLFCLRPPARAECYGRGGLSKPACPTPKCNGRHAASVHDAFMGASASVSLMTDEGDKYDEMLMSTLREQETRRTGGRIWRIRGWKWKPKRTKMTAESSA